MNTSLKQKQTHRYTEQTYGCQPGAGQGRWGVRDQQMQTVVYRTDKQQGSTVQHKELYSISPDKP